MSRNLLRLSSQEAQTLARYQNGISPLRVGVLLEKPFAYHCYFEKNITRHCQPGLCIELTELVFQILNISFEFVPLNHTDYGILKNGSWDGAIRDILDEKIDTAMPLFTPTEDRRIAVDFSGGFIYAQMVFASRYSAMSDTPIMSALSRFSAEILSLALFLSIVVSSLILFSSQFQSFVTLNPKKSNLYGGVLEDMQIFGNLCIKTCLSFTGQSIVGPKHLKTCSAKIALGVWALGMVVLVGFYSGNLLAGFIKRPVGPPYHDIETLAFCIRRHQCQLVVLTASASGVEPLVSKNPTNLTTEQTKLRAALTINPLKVIPKAQKALLHVQEQKSHFAVLWLEQEIFTEAVDNLDSDVDACKFHLTPAGKEADSFPFSKKHAELVKLVSKAQAELKMTGLVPGLEEKYKTPVCQEKPEAVQAITIEPVFGMFLLLACGIVVSCFAFLGEFASYRKF